jgi:alcohol dehydrogenase
MRAIAYDRCGGPIAVRELPDPEPEAGEVVVRVRAAGLCRSDWHGWRGHDPDIRSFPHVPGHELAGEVESLGAGVERFRAGERVTVPFVAGCGRCETCAGGDPQVCPHQAQPGFTHWGAFAERVRIRYADFNLVRLPAALDFAAAAALGCRFTTAYRAVVAQGRAKSGEWVAVHGCGGVGLSAIMIARSLGCRVVAIDVAPAALELARRLGAEHALDARAGEVPARVVEVTAGGAHVSLDALGNAAVLESSVLGLRRRGRHVQVGLLVGEESRARVPMARVVAWELELLGSHGMQAALFPPLFDLIAQGRLDPASLITRRVTLDEAAAALAGLDRSGAGGIAVIDRF